MSNFSNLIAEISSEIQHQTNENTMAKCLNRLNKTQARCKAGMSNFFNQSHALKKSLSPSKAEIRQANRKKIQRIRQSIKDGILSKSMTSLQTIKLENAANALQIKLQQRGLI